jgi:hypothetical protein
VYPSFYLVGLAQAAKADSARVGLVIEHMRHLDDPSSRCAGACPG